MREQNLFIIGLVFLLGLNFAPLAFVKAQETAGLRVQPAIIEEKVDPGQIFSSTIRATNISSEKKTFYIIKRNISHLSEKGFPVFAQEGEETGFEISSWIRVGQEQIVIASGQTKAIPFSITVPQDASPGGHFGAIFLSFTPEHPKETGVGVGFQVGTIINLRIAGEVFEEAQIREFRTDHAIYSKPDVKFITRVENIGNVLLRPRGPLEITDFFGKKVATLIVNNEGTAVLPKAVRQYDISWQGEGLTFGRYQALISLVFGEEDQATIFKTASFWILPLNIILPITGGILVLILFTVILVKLHIRRKLRQLRETTENASHRGRFGSVEQELYHLRHGAPFSRLALVAVTMLIFTLVFLLVLFFLFA